MLKTVQGLNSTEIQWGCLVLNNMNLEFCFPAGGGVSLVLDPNPQVALSYNNFKN